MKSPFKKSGPRVLLRPDRMTKSGRLNVADLKKAQKKP